MHWRRKWQRTPVFLPGESQGRVSLVGCHLWGCKETDTTEQLSLHFITEGAPTGVRTPAPTSCRHAQTLGQKDQPQTPHNGGPLHVPHRPVVQPTPADRGRIHTSCGHIWPLPPFVNQRRRWHPTPVLLPGKSHGWRSVVGCSPWGREESDTTK